MLKRYRFPLYTGFMFILPLLAYSTTINVPLDQPTIQAGINAAADGDTVLVAPGAYYESINYNGKLVVVKSSDGALNTIITNDPSVNLVTFENYEDDSAVLEGFTLQGGRIAVMCKNAGPVIKYNLLIDQNITSWAAISLGQAGGPTYSAPAIIQNNTISNCANGGISSFSYDAPTIRNNLVVFNMGYGIHIAGLPAPVNILYNNVYGNSINFIGEFEVLLGISEDPLINEDYTLDIQSPCINAGDPDPLFIDPDGTRSDIGALCYHLTLPIADQITYGPMADSFIVYTAEPEISWVYFDTAATVQVQYQCQIGTDEDWSEVEIWDSGPVTSAENGFVYYGPTLDDNGRYYLRIRVNNGNNWGDWMFDWFYTYAGHVVGVPEDFPTIGEAVLVTLSDDTILVSPGTYTENIEITDRSIFLISESGPEETSIRPRLIDFPIIAIDNCSPTISGFTIERGMYISNVAINGSAILENNVFRHYHGGGGFYDGIVMIESQSPIIRNNVFYDCSTVAINIHSNPVVYHYPVINNNLFYDCQGAIDLWHEALVINNTFDNNYYGIYVIMPDINIQIAPPIKNNIFSNHDYGGVDCRWNVWPWEGEYYIEYNDFWNNGDTWYEFDSYYYNINIFDDPQYADVSALDYRLRPSSPCIDAGDPHAKYNDPDGSRNDMGAFPSFRCGDVNYDGDINIYDISLLINYYFDGGPAPISISTSDLGCDGRVDLIDIVYLYNILFNEATGGCCQ